MNDLTKDWMNEWIRLYSIIADWETLLKKSVVFKKWFLLGPYGKLEPKWGTLKRKRVIKPCTQFLALEITKEIQLKFKWNW